MPAITGGQGYRRRTTHTPGHTYVHPGKSGSFDPTVNRLYAVPWYLEAGSYDQLAIRTFSNAGAGGVLRFCLWATHATEIRPGALLWQSEATISFTTSGNKFDAFAAPVACLDDWHWVGLVAQVATTSGGGVSAVKEQAQEPLWGKDDDPNLSPAAIYMDGVNGAIPDTFVPAQVTDQGPKFQIRRSA